MANRTTVNVSLTPELGAFIHSRVRSGRYQTASELVQDALRLLQQQEKERKQALRELKAKLNRGAAQARSGKLLDGDAVFEELRELVAERSQPDKKSPQP